MIKLMSGDIFRSDCKILVNTVNCKGAMGKGLALQFKEQYPYMYLAYRSVCGGYLKNGGDIWLWRNPDTQTTIDDEVKHDVLCFATKEDWRNPSDIKWIERGLVNFREMVKNDKSIYSAAFPKLGCSNGGLDWKDVWPVMKRYLEPLEIPVEIWI